MTTSHPAPRLRPVIRVFVSSTFPSTPLRTGSDMRHEPFDRAGSTSLTTGQGRRNALQTDVYPKLEALCQKNGFQCQARKEEIKP